jgi:hypothetical protein
MVEEMGTLEAEHVGQAEIEGRISHAKSDGESGSEGMASVTQLFQFATPLDLLLLTLGTLCSGVVGAAQPGMMLLFADLINSVGTLLGGNDVSCPKSCLCPFLPQTRSLFPSCPVASREKQRDRKSVSSLSRGPTKGFTEGA